MGLLGPGFGLGGLGRPGLHETPQVLVSEGDRDPPTREVRNAQRRHWLGYELLLELGRALAPKIKQQLRLVNLEIEMEPVPLKHCAQDRKGAERPG